jgi:hypothetical protein
MATTTAGVIEEQITQHYMEAQRIIGELQGRLEPSDVQKVQRVSAHAREQGRLQTQLGILQSWGLR